jgi:hypothetical protein
MSLMISSSTKKKEIVEYISALTETVPIYYYKPSKDIHLVTQSLLNFKILQIFMSKS